MRAMLNLTFIAFFIAALASMSADAQVATLEGVTPDRCDFSIPGGCGARDAIVFVHGIYGGRDTFKNARTGFDWPSELPNSIEGNWLDVFKLNYQSALLAWARGANPSFDQLARDVRSALKPLRIGGYRSIGFIAHSLGGNVVSTYVHSVKTQFGHSQRSQNAFIITLATPVLGAQIANLASILKSRLLMSDPLLTSLKSGNLYLTMLQEFRELEDEKEGKKVCRPVNLHAAVEKKYLGPLLVVTPGSAARPISDFVKSPIVGFDLNHLDIAKPERIESGVYIWVLDRLVQEYMRINNWEEAHLSFPEQHKLCEREEFLPETP